MRIEDLRSYKLNRAALDRAGEDWPEASVVIARNLRKYRELGGHFDGYLDRCDELFAAGYEEMRAAFLADTDEGQVLRSINPFAGLLTTEERFAVIRETTRPGQLPPRRFPLELLE